MWLSHSFCLNYGQQWWHSDFMLYISLHNNVLSGLFCILANDHILKNASEVWTAGTMIYYKHMTQWMSNWLMGWAQRVTVNVNIRLATGHSWGSIGLCLGPCAFQYLQK